jgi:glutamate N-acetyltransferase/amino-acid N-acetyltransferase
MIADDGEGATHLITIDVSGCRDRDGARAIARAVADSPLVKTAIHGRRPELGPHRLGGRLRRGRFEEGRALALAQRHPAVPRRRPAALRRPAVSALLRARRETHIRLTLNQGDRRVRFWTCDLTADTSGSTPITRPEFAASSAANPPGG